MVNRWVRGIAAWKEATRKRAKEAAQKAEEEEEAHGGDLEEETTAQLWCGRL